MMTDSRLVLECSLDSPQLMRDLFECLKENVHEANVIVKHDGISLLEVAKSDKMQIIVHWSKASFTRYKCHLPASKFRVNVSSVCKILGMEPITSTLRCKLTDRKLEFHFQEEGEPEHSYSVGVTAASSATQTQEENFELFVGDKSAMERLEMAAWEWEKMTTSFSFADSLSFQFSKTIKNRAKCMINTKCKAANPTTLRCNIAYQDTEETKQDYVRVHHISEQNEMQYNAKLVAAAVGQKLSRRAEVLCGLEKQMMLTYKMDKSGRDLGKLQYLIQWDHENAED